MRDILEFICSPLYIMYVVIVLGGFFIYKAHAEQPMTPNERRTLLEVQAQDAAKRQKIRYINSAMRRTEQPDDVFLEHGREDVRSLGVDLLQCFKEVEAKEKELEGIKKVLLEKGP